MRKVLFAAVAAAASAAILAGGTGTAFAADPPETFVCVGAAQDNGSFQPQMVSLPPSIGLSTPLCASLNANAVSKQAQSLLAFLTGIKPPSTPPSQEDLLNLVNTLSHPPNDGVFTAVDLAFATCQAFHISDTCSNTLIALLGSTNVLPVGKSVTLDGTSGFCFQGSQSGTGQAFGSDFYQLNWTATYGGDGAVGTISGTASGFFGGSGTSQLSGYIAPGCGSGVKALVLQIGPEA